MKVLVLSLEGVDALGRTVESLLVSAHELEFVRQHLTRTNPAADELSLGKVFESMQLDIGLVCVCEESLSQAELMFKMMGRCGWEIPLMIILEAGALQDLHKLLDFGAVDFLLSPIRSEELLARSLLLHQRVSQPEAAPSQLKQKLGLKQFIGESPALSEAIKSIPKLARCDVNAFITGETGTGKEMFARAIHYLSPRADHPFIPVNCGAIPGELVENELFGHEQGAFTGASSSARGLVHDAEGGTLFLDEIDSLPLHTQVKFLRFLQDQEYRPLGARKSCQANVRVIAASNANLEGAVRAGQFRADLYYRLNVLPVTLPALRQRKEDIPALARHFAAKYGREFSMPPKQLSQTALHKLMAYEWPGNVRELENVVQRAVLMAERANILSSDVVLPDLPEDAPTRSFKALKATVIANFERSYLEQLLETHQGNITRAAHAAKKNRRAFWQLLRKHNVRLPHQTSAAVPADLDRPRLA